MALPVNAGKIIKEGTVEKGCLEYMTNWDPEEALHTITAFANDYDEVGGGYLVVGIEQDGKEKIVKGLSNKEIEQIEQDLSKKCNLIEPKFRPSTSVETLGDRKILLIWAPNGNTRPYKCPVAIQPKKNKDYERGCYIRRTSRTVRANYAEEQELIVKSRHTTFDEDFTPGASIGDLRLSNIEDYLDAIGNMKNKGYGTKDYLEDMKLLVGKERNIPMNVAILMFCDNPEIYFSGARIEVIISDPHTGMTEVAVFRGPLARQLVSALSHIRNAAIRGRTSGIDPDLFFNYPYDAVKEILVDAAWHRNYHSTEPITIKIDADKLEVYCPRGIDPSLQEIYMEAQGSIGPYNRNRRLGTFLRELELAGDVYGNSPTIIESLERNGSPPPVYEIDVICNALRATIPIHPLFLENPPVFVETMEQDLHPIRKRGTIREVREEIERLVTREDGMTSKEIHDLIETRCSDNTFRKALNELLAEGRLKYLYPENPRDPRQRICPA